MEPRVEADSSTEALASAARAGDRRAFSILCERSRRLVAAYALAQLRDPEDAEDVTQETFVRALSSVARLRAAGTWDAWLMSIARNCCRDHLRRKRVRATEPLNPEWLAGDPSPEVLVMTEERRQQIRLAVEGLPETCRIALLMRFESGCSRREIAVALGVRESTVMGRLARAARRLRERLQEEV
jgi:RNA polymerase sigma-70 factor (ECF subfamily)